MFVEVPMPRRWQAKEQRIVDAVAVQVIRGEITRELATMRLTRLLAPRSAGSVDARLGYTIGVYRVKLGVPAKAGPTREVRTTLFGE